MAAFDPEREAHKAWLGLLQPTGLVVSPPALSKAGAQLDKNISHLQPRLLDLLTLGADADGPLLPHFWPFAQDLLDWSPADLLGLPDGPPVPEEISVILPSERETLRPSFVVIDAQGDSKPLLLVLELPPRTPLDTAPEDAHAPWQISPQARLERLLHGTGISAGLLFNGETLRLVYAPRGETSGFLSFPLLAMASVRDRDVLSAAVMLLHQFRVFSAPDGMRLLDILRESRKYQNEVSTRLADQVQGALWELLRGFQAADEQAQGRVLHSLPQDDPTHIYGGLLSVIMRLVFLLYAEDQGLLPDHPVYASYYSVGGLYERLRDDAGRYPDTMNQRYGAWAWLLSTFRFVFDGGGHGRLRLPPRHGQLFNPDEYPFLEGRPRHVHRVMGEIFDPPRVSDGVVWRVLEGLLVLDGERLSYRTLDVEQIGSVYESIMGFEVCTFPGRALALKPSGLVIDLDHLLKTPPAKRAAWLEEQAECKLSGASLAALKDATSAEALVAALGRKVSERTPQPLPPGALFLQPGEERRRSGSHYTPRELTGPLVQKTLRPVLERLGDSPSPEQVLELKVCDPAMGSGAFLVETCRQLAEQLVRAWEQHHSTPTDIPSDETPLLYARRLVAQRCLYGVDKNPFAVSLARLSLWLVTLARDHAFTFLDHALKHGDSLVGLGTRQLSAFHWSPAALDSGPLFANVSTTANQASAWRQRIQELGDGDYDQRRARWEESEKALEDARLIGDACLAAFFSASKDKDREKARQQALDWVNAWQRGNNAEAKDKLRGGVASLRLSPFHWELEFPEVFSRSLRGFDACIGNPPFAGKNTIASAHPPAYLDWLKTVHSESHGNADLVAHFFRRAFVLLREEGSFGLIATNTIAQGDTRGTGLRWIRKNGGVIYDANRRYKWPGLAAVIVSTVCVQKTARDLSPVLLDERPVPHISAFLFSKPGDDDPHTLRENQNKSFQGSIVLGMGFTFDDTNPDATPIAEMHRLIQKDPRNAARIFPYLGGEELNSSPTHAHHRYVINFGEMTEEEARAWPDLFKIIEEKVKPERLKNNRENYRNLWWRFGEYRPGLFVALRGLPRVLACSRVSQYICFSFLPSSIVLSERLTVLSMSSFSSFSTVQSRIHELWALYFGSTLEDRPLYTPSDCFETFPFPVGWEENKTLEEAGQRYYDFRAAWMVAQQEGLTKTYNRFHDPEEAHPDIVQLRALHSAMDRAVLDAYGWNDLAPTCSFFTDYHDEDDTGRRKKPWRFRWPDSLREEVLARLIALNQARYQAQRLDGPSSPAPSRAPKTSAPSASHTPAPNPASPSPDAPKTRGRPKKGSNQGELL